MTEVSKEQEEFKKAMSDIFDGCYSEGNPNEYPGLMIFQRQKALNEIMSLLIDKCVVVDKDMELPMTGVEADMWQKGWRLVKKIV